MLYWSILFVVVLAGIISLYLCRFHPLIVKLKAQGTLQKIIFPEGNSQKREILDIFHDFTNRRFSDDQLLDYFIKIKGLQNMSLGYNSSYWIKKYLLSPTEIKLNYFEQVKFYEMFLNFTVEQVQSKKTRGATPNSLIHISSNHEEPTDKKSKSRVKKNSKSQVTRTPNTSRN